MCAGMLCVRQYCGAASGTLRASAAAIALLGLMPNPGCPMNLGQVAGGSPPPPRPMASVQGRRITTREDSRTSRRRGEPSRRIGTAVAARMPLGRPSRRDNPCGLRSAPPYRLAKRRHATQRPADRLLHQLRRGRRTAQYSRWLSDPEKPLVEQQSSPSRRKPSPKRRACGYSPRRHPSPCSLLHGRAPAFYSTSAVQPASCCLRALEHQRGTSFSLEHRPRVHQRGTASCGSAEATRARRSPSRTTAPRR